MSTRPYQKRNPDYWNGRKNKTEVLPPSMSNIPTNMTQAAAWDVEPSFDEQPHFTAKAACGGGSSSVYRDRTADSAFIGDRYQNIRSGLIPYSVSEGGYQGMSDVIGLCYQAYYNFALLRNTVKLLRDFSVSQIHVKTPNRAAKIFIETWMQAIGINQFMMQFFLEYYRSGNVFIYKFDGEIQEDAMTALKQASAGEITALKKSEKVPIRYIILNPMQVYLQMGATTNMGWVRMLSTYEIARLKNPQTPEDEQVLNSFPKIVRDQIKQKGGIATTIYAPLDPKRLFTVFYDKTDYEPLAVPMAYPVLNDIEFKLELRRMDMALASTIENVILLVTTGRPADQWNQVPPKTNLTALQDMLRNKTIGRALVADYTTKAEFVVPDIKELFGPEKYLQVDRDIKEGLASILSGEDKFANAAIKVKIFIEGLKEGRRAFMETFLMPEVKKICEVMGFRQIPTLEWEEIQIQDEALMSRLFVQMYQLGALTPDELNKALTTGLLPSPDESVISQIAYKAARSKDLYQPVAPKADPAAAAGGKGRPAGSGGTPAKKQVSSPIGTKKVRKASLDEGEFEETDERPPYSFNLTKLAHNTISMNGLRAEVEKAIIKDQKLKRELDVDEKMFATSLTQAIAFNEEGGENGIKWVNHIKAYLKSPKEIPGAVLETVADIRANFDTPENPVDNWMGAILYQSKI